MSRKRINKKRAALVLVLGMTIFGVLNRTLAYVDNQRQIKAEQQRIEEEKRKAEEEKLKILSFYHH